MFQRDCHVVKHATDLNESSVERECRNRKELGYDGEGENSGPVFSVKRTVIRSEADPGRKDGKDQGLKQQIERGQIQLETKAFDIRGGREKKSRGKNS